MRHDTWRDYAVRLREELSKHGWSVSTEELQGGTDPWRLAEWRLVSEWTPQGLAMRLSIEADDHHVARITASKETDSASDTNEAVIVMRRHWEDEFPAFMATLDKIRDAC